MFVEVKDLQPFMSYDEVNQAIEFTQPIEGEYAITIVLRDASGLKTENEFLFKVQGEEAL